MTDVDLLIGQKAVAGSIPVALAAEQAVAPDAAASADELGMIPVGVREDVPQADASAQGNYSRFKTDREGRLRVTSDTLTGDLQTTNELLFLLLVATDKLLQAQTGESVL